MALRIRDGWLNGDFGLPASFRAHDAALWDESGWADVSNPWVSLWAEAPSVLGAGPLHRTWLTSGEASQGGCGCLSCALSSKMDQALKAEAADPTGGAGPGAAAPASPGGDGPQFLGDAIGDNTSSSATIAIGGTLNSLVDHNGDVDYVRVSLVAGQTYTFSLTGGSLSDPYLELRNAGGAIINDGVFSDDGGIGLNAFMMYRATTTGDHWIVARHWNISSGTGTYTLDVDAIETGNSSPTFLADNGKPQFSWEEAAIQITRTGATWASAFDSPAVVTYAYRSTDPGDLPDDAAGFSRFSAAQIVATEASLAAWAGVANITFVRVNDGDGYSDNATMLFANYNSGVDRRRCFRVPSQQRFHRHHGFRRGARRCLGQHFAGFKPGSDGRRLRPSHAHARDRPRDRAQPPWQL